MKSEKEQLLKETYDKFIQISISDFPMEGMDEFVDEDIMGYGTTLDEKCMSINDYRELVFRQREQGKDIEMTSDITPVLHRITSDGNSAVFIDEIVITMLVDNKTHRLFLRISTVLEYREEKWIVVHWHGSLPGEVEGETDTWHINEWQQKNEKLERMVAEKTTDLELKNRELEIETALEKVRSSALAMKEPSDMLGVCRIISDQLKLLCVNDIRNVQTAIINESKGTYLNYQYFTAYDRNVVEETEYKKHPTALAMVQELRKSADAFFNGSLEGEELNTFREWRKKDNQFPDPLLDETTSAYYYFYSIGDGGLGLTTYNPIIDADHDIFKRFHNVFSLAYRRFIDIELAITQAKEAQIELALERIRAQAMAMQESSDLLDIVVTMRSEFIALGHEAHYFWHMRWLPEMYEKAMTSGDGTRIGMVMELPRGFHENAAMIEWEKNDEPVAVFTFDTEGAIDYVDRMTQMGRFHEIDHNAPGPDDIRAIGGLTFVMARTTHGEIGYSLPGVVADPPAEDLSTLARFAGAFDLAYRRFEDLKEAEAQAREAQIEVALERVRSKAMAMHSSEDLAETVDTFFSELTKLNVTPHRCGVGITDTETKITDIRATTTTRTNEIKKMAGKLKLSGHPVLDSIFEHWKIQKEYHPVLRGNEIKDYYKVMNPQIAFPDFADDEVQYGYYFYFEEGGVFAWTDNELAESDLQIFRRYTSVLSLTYRRYMDLKEAEAQAREAQIEAAMEKVRARSLIMQKAEELIDVATVLRHEMGSLGIEELETSSIYIVNETTGITDCWYAIKDIRSKDKKLVNDHMAIKLKDTWVGREMQKFYKSKKKQSSIVMQGENRIEWINYCAGHSEVLEGYYGDKIPERTYHLVKFSNGYMGAASPGDISDESLDLLHHAASVFSLAFTRFLDLQNAERQNRIIQAENERKTKELEEARQLQISMLPKEIPQLPHLDIAVYMQTATEVGGDYYDFSTHEDGSLNICIGDATGHGMKAGVMVSSMKSIFTTNSPKMSLESFFSTANSGVKSMGLKRMMMGFSMLNINRNEFKIVNAGMPPVFLFRKKSKSVEEIKEHGMPIGAMNHSQYIATDEVLEKGDVLLLMSDGMPELQNENNEMYDYEQIRVGLKNVAEREPEEIIGYLKDESSAWLNDKDLEDDVTFVVIKVKC